MQLVDLVEGYSQTLPKAYTLTLISSTPKDSK